MKLKKNRQPDQNAGFWTVAHAIYICTQVAQIRTPASTLGVFSVYQIDDSCYANVCEAQYSTVHLMH